MERENNGGKYGRAMTEQSGRGRRKQQARRENGK